MEWLNSSRLDTLTELRHALHGCAELSEHEFETSEKTLDWLKQWSPDRLIHPLGPTGVAAVFEGQRAGPTVVFRCELDGLAIPETISPAWASRNDGVSHKCGHDGHMSVLAGMA
ncbi:MAG: amidohydrolase, partial [Pseudomonadales bacterium]|nr:amidohydrolase [Pseudomonadales bacterium]